MDDVRNMAAPPKRRVVWSGRPFQRVPICFERKQSYRRGISRAVQSWWAESSCPSTFISVLFSSLPQCLNRGCVLPSILCPQAFFLFCLLRKKMEWVVSGNEFKRVDLFQVYPWIKVGVLSAWIKYPACRNEGIYPQRTLGYYPWNVLTRWSQHDLSLPSRLILGNSLRVTGTRPTRCEVLHSSFWRRFVKCLCWSIIVTILMLGAERFFFCGVGTRVFEDDWQASHISVSPIWTWVSWRDVGWFHSNFIVFLKWPPQLFLVEVFRLHPDGSSIVTCRGDELTYSIVYSTFSTIKCCVA